METSKLGAVNLGAGQRILGCWNIGCLEGEMVAMELGAMEWGPMI